MGEFKFEIKKDIGVLSQNGNYSKEFKLISYNGAEPKYDIRSWSLNKETGEKTMGKGVTLSKEELKVLKALLNDISLED